jgi:hypothetical protein
MKEKRVLVIIPAFNEEKSIKKVCESLKKLNYDFVVINDCSLDQTKNICIENNYKVINLVHNLGIGGAVQTGYKYAYENDYDIAIQFDGDGQHNAEYIEELIDPIINGEVDFVIGSRFIEKVSRFKSTRARRIGINIISFFIRFVTGKKIYDTTSGFRAVNKKIIKVFSNYYPTEYPEPVSTTYLLKMGYKVDEVPVEMNERKAGVSSIRKWKNLYYMVNVILSILVVGMRRYK